MRSVFGVMAPLLVALLVPQGAAADGAGVTAQAPGEQMAAPDDPEVEGPLELADIKCDRKRQMDGHVTAAVARRCLRYYRYDPGAETDPARDYGVLWLQSTVDGRNGWCTGKVASKIILPVGLGLHNHAPDGERKVPRRTDITTELMVNADSFGEEGRVGQQWIAYPKSFSASLNEDQTRFKLRWKGKTARKLGFAHGIEISWESETPPEGISFRLNFRLAEC